MKRVNWITITVPILIFTVIFTIYYQDKQFDKQLAKERAEIQRLLDKRDAESEQHVTQHDHNHLDHPPDHTTDKPIYKDSNASMANGNGQRVRYYLPGEIHIHTYRYTDGIYKGMTYAEAYKAWKAKRDEILDRFIANNTKVRELAEAKIDSADAKLSTILTIFKSMSPEELEIAKSETLKDYPNKADEIESFFNDVANHDTTKSLGEIAKDYEFIKESDKIIWTATYKNRAESDKIDAELEKVKKEKPNREEAIKLAEIANKQQGNRE